MKLTDDQHDRVDAIARRHGFSPDAAQAVLSALIHGHGMQAQFDHPELGGMGQWSGGMLMIGDMFNSGLKARVEGLVRDLAEVAGFLLRQQPAQAGHGGEWPSDLGTPSASGAQGDMRYAVFPASRRLAVMQGGRLSLYDTGDHRIGGVSQQQAGTRTLQFTSQHGPVALDSLTPVAVSGSGPSPSPSPAPEGPEAEPAARPAPADDSIPAMIERLHALLVKGILTQAEFEAKKADLLSRL